MKRIITIIIFVLSLNSAFAQTYTLTSNSFVTIKEPYERKEYNQRSIIVVDMNKLTIEIYRGNNHYYLKILEQKRAHDGGRNFKCLDIRKNKRINCWVNYNDMSAMAGRSLYQLWVSYDKLNVYYLIDG